MLVRTLAYACVDIAAHSWITRQQYTFAGLSVRQWRPVIVSDAFSETPVTVAARRVLDHGIVFRLHPTTKLLRLSAGMQLNLTAILMKASSAKVFASSRASPSVARLSVHRRRMVGAVAPVWMCTRPRHKPGSTSSDLGKNLHPCGFCRNGASGRDMAADERLLITFWGQSVCPLRQRFLRR